MNDDQKKKAMDHIKDHVGGYPTTKKTLVESCNNMSEFNEEEKKWFMEKLSHDEYATPEDVMKDLGWEE